MLKRIKKMFTDEQESTYNEPLENYFKMGSDKEDICGTRKAKREI
jgi:hypothetical protein